MINRLMIATGLLCVAGMAQAAGESRGPQYDPGFYGGVSVGESSGKLQLTDDFFGVYIEGEDEALGVKVFAGYKFNPHVALEGSYTRLGEFSGELVPGVDLSVEPHLFTGSLVFSAPFENGLSLFARTGWSYWNYDVQLDTISDNETDFGLHLGVGGAFTVGNAQYRIEWEQSQIKESEDDVRVKLTGRLLSIGAVFFF